MKDSKRADPGKKSEEERKCARDFRSATATRRCPRCRSDLIELADGSFFCQKCSHVFAAHKEAFYTPLFGRPAGKETWDGVRDNIEKLVEKDYEKGRR